METKQIEFWNGDFGDAYVERNIFSLADLDALYIKLLGVEYSKLVEVFLSNIPKDASILEVGCNVGNILSALSNLGFTNARGIDVNPKMVSKAKQLRPELNIQVGSAFDLPFEPNSFDLVYTSDVLIHIAPEDNARARAEIARASKRYIWGFEYWGKEYEMVEYRGYTDRMWRADFAQEYIKQFPNLKVEKKALFPRLTEPKLKEIMFLLEKGQ